MFLNLFDKDGGWVVKACMGTMEDEGDDYSVDSNEGQKILETRWFGLHGIQLRRRLEGLLTLEEDTLDILGELAWVLHIGGTQGRLWLEMRVTDKDG